MTAPRSVVLHDTTYYRADLVSRLVADLVKRIENVTVLAIESVQARHD